MAAIAPFCERRGAEPKLLPLITSKKLHPKCGCQSSTSPKQKCYQKITLNVYLSTFFYTHVPTVA
jgi:hypothetical protein